VFEKLRPLARAECPFVNLPETRQTRWGEALTAEKMKKCIWVNPELVAQIEFLEWTESDHLRHAKFAGLRDDKDARTVVKERAGRREPDDRRREGLLLVQSANPNQLVYLPRPHRVKQGG